MNRSETEIKNFVVVESDPQDPDREITSEVGENEAIWVFANRDDADQVARFGNLTHYFRPDEYLYAITAAEYTGTSTLVSAPEWVLAKAKAYFAENHEHALLGNDGGVN